MALTINNRVYDIIREIGNHRTGKYSGIMGQYVDQRLDPIFRSIQGMEVALCQLNGLSNWWIIPAMARDDDRLEDIGPFTDMEDAIMNYYLYTDPSTVF